MQLKLINGWKLEQLKDHWEFLISEEGFVYTKFHHRIGNMYLVREEDAVARLKETLITSILGGLYFLKEIDLSSNGFAAKRVERVFDFQTDRQIPVSSNRFMRTIQKIHETKYGETIYWSPIVFGEG